MVFGTLHVCWKAKTNESKYVNFRSYRKPIQPTQKTPIFLAHYNRTSPPWATKHALERFSGPTFGKLWVVWCMPNHPRTKPNIQFLFARWGMFRIPWATKHAFRFPTVCVYLCDHLMLGDCLVAPTNVFLLIQDSRTQPARAHTSS
jgi:hypothetical protein